MAPKAKVAPPKTNRARKSTATRPADIPPAPPVAASSRDSKQARLIALLHTPSGATLVQMMTLTGWQAHTVRGTISGVLRKKLGLHVTCEPATDTNPRRYRIACQSAA